MIEELMYTLRGCMRGARAFARTALSLDLAHTWRLRL